MLNTYSKLAMLCLTLALTVACQQKQERPRSVRAVDASLESHVKTLEEALQFKVDYSVKFADLEDNTVGLCNRSTFGVQIDRSYFEYYESFMPRANEAVMLHELGHCSFGLQHDDREFTSGPMAGCPMSVMSTYTLEYCYSSNRQYYINEIASKLGVVALEAPEIESSRKLGPQKPILGPMRMDGGHDHEAH